VKKKNAEIRKEESNLKTDSSEITFKEKEPDWQPANKTKK
jgi:hypothetical protein